MAYCIRGPIFADMQVCEVPTLWTLSKHVSRQFQDIGAHLKLLYVCHGLPRPNVY